MPVSCIHTVLRNRLYTGEFDWKGRLYKGRHEPLVTRELWERVQGVLDGRNARKTRRGPRDFAFSGLVTCGHCGCAMVGEIKKAKYIYYHCTGYKQRCGERYVREEVLADRFAQLLDRLSFDEVVLDWFSTALRESHADVQREHETAIFRLQAEYERLQQRLHAMYVDKLDGRIDATFFEKMSAEWRSEQDRCLREIGWHQSADQAYLAEGARLLDLAHNAKRLFVKQAPREKRRLLNFVLSNSSWMNGDLHATFRQPFDLLAETTAIVASQSGEEGKNLPGHPGWLGN